MSSLSRLASRVRRGSGTTARHPTLRKDAHGWYLVDQGRRVRLSGLGTTGSGAGVRVDLPADAARPCRVVLDFYQPDVNARALLMQVYDDAFSGGDAPRTTAAYQTYGRVQAAAGDTVINQAAVSEFHLTPATLNSAFSRSQGPLVLDIGRRLNVRFTWRLSGMFVAAGDLPQMADVSGLYPTNLAVRALHFFLSSSAEFTTFSAKVYQL